MAVSLRTGQFGSYYGNDYNSSNALTQAQMEVNATYIYSYLTSKGWSINAIAAMLGNMQAESTINPGRWQGNNVGGGPAYGIVQWDPFTKYTGWATSNGFSDPSEMDSNLARIIYEVNNKLQWYGRGNYAGMSFAEFATSSQSVAFLAIGFLLCYERPADQSQSVQNYRASLAEAWYKYLTGVDPTPPSGGEGGNTGSGIRRKGKFNFILFNKRRKRVYG